MKNENTAVALGAFDGLHLGHRAVIGAAVRQAAAGLTPAVLTFREDPSKALTGSTEYLISDKEKADLLVQMGIQKTFVLDFAAIRDLSPQAFVGEVLLRQCGAKTVVCGENFHFGKNASGDTELLGRLCRDSGVEVIAVPPLSVEGRVVSSTRIRAALREGRVDLAAQLLGRRFGFSFKVIQGNRIGRTLGTPTINQQLPEGFVKPKFGVYASLVYVDGKPLCGVTNIGVKPTVGHYKPLSETWIPDFSKDMYNQEIRVELLAFIRSEKKFESLEALRKEIFENADKAREICRGLTS